MSVVSLGFIQWKLFMMSFVMKCPTTSYYMLQVAYNLGLGSLTWVVATEVLPIRSKIVALANCQIKFILFNL